jgi:hypothetical protein
VASLEAVFVVRNHDEEVYRGKSLDDAMAAYNGI